MERTEALQPATVNKSDAEWRAELTPDEYSVLREAGTEVSFRRHATDPTQYDWIRIAVRLSGVTAGEAERLVAAGILVPTKGLAVPLHVR